jgi:hypothetical protein
MEVTSLNWIMGDFNKGFNILLDTQQAIGRKGRSDSSTFRFCFYSNQQDYFAAIIKCGSQPCLLLSKFFQLHKPIIHETLFMIVARLTQMRETSFLMYGDISHSPEVLDLTKRTKTICVVSSHHLADPGDGQERGRPWRRPGGTANGRLHSTLLVSVWE